MSLASVQNASLVTNKPIQFKGKYNTEYDDYKRDFAPKKESNKVKTDAKILAVALSSAVLGGVIARKKFKFDIGLLEHKVRNLTEENDGIKQIIKKTEEQVTELTNKNETLKKLNKALTEETEKAKSRLTDIFEGDINPSERRAKIFEELKAKVDNGTYGYDIETPPVTNIGGQKVYDDAVPFPEPSTTRNRIHMKELDIPEIKEDGSFEYQLPMSDEVHLSFVNPKDREFDPISKATTSISESYASSVQWDNDKIARDLLQNFYDGHGQTLDGVKLQFVPTKNGKYKVRIEGQSTYAPDKAVYIGESSKKDNARAAGNYGEGLKMAVLKLLKDQGAENVEIASDVWKLNYTLEKGNLSDKRVLSYSLGKVDQYDGNYLEFETNNKDLLESLRTTINRFYNSGNTHFKCPDFENSVIGIKNLERGEKGGFYIAGQRFEFDGKYDGLKEIAIFLKEKPPIDILDPSRDRISLNTSDLENIGRWLARSNNISKDDKVKILRSLDPYWKYKNYFDLTPVDKFISSFLRELQYIDNIDKSKAIHIKYPDEYVAFSNASNDIIMDLQRNGYIVCKGEFSGTGMKTIHDVVGDARKHEVVVPNEQQKKKILVLKEAIKKLSPALEEKHFTPEELDTHIYMFNNKSDKDKNLYSDCVAEAIIDKGTSRGFWIDENYLDSAKFADVLETALHELSHKVGGDETAEFSYKLTNVNKEAINQIMNDPKTRVEFQALNSLWESLA